MVDEYHYVEIDQSILSFRERIYLPVYTNSYFTTSEVNTSLMASVHIENKSSFEPIYVLTADYYDSNGNLSDQLIEQVIRIEPGESSRLILNKRLLTKSTGKNVIVDWGSKTIDKKPRITIEVSYITASGIRTVNEEGIIISDQDEILDRRPL